MNNDEFGRVPCEPKEWWPVKEPLEFADFSYDATNDITSGTVVDPIVAITFNFRPSGAGEIVASRLTLTGNIITVWLADGMPGRVYLYQLEFTTVAGRTFQILIGQVCDPLLAGIQVPLPLVPGFGTPLTWP